MLRRSSHRIVQVGGDLRDGVRPLTLSVPPRSRVPKLRIYSSFKYPQGRCLSRFPAQPVPLLESSVSTNISPDTQPMWDVGEGTPDSVPSAARCRTRKGRVLLVADGRLAP